MKFLIIYYFYCVLIFNHIFGQNFTENTTFSDSLFDDIKDEDVFRNEFNSTDEAISEDNDPINDMSVSEAFPPRIETKHDLDNSLHNFLDSGMDLLLETRHVFNEELNESKSDSEAKDVWIAYSNSWGRIFNSLIKEIMPKIMSSETADIDISLDCMSAILEVVGGLKQQKDWAVKLFDSSGRVFSPGSLDATVTSLGDYDQCLSIEKDNYDTDSLDFVGKYCILKYKLALPNKPKRLTLRSQVFNFTNTPVSGTFLEHYSHSSHAFYDRFGRIGICIPSLCSNFDFQSIIKRVLSESHLNLTINDCHTKVLPKLSSLQITIIWIFVTVFCLMVLSTSLDLILSYTKDLQQAQFIRVESQIKKNLLATILSFSVYKNGKNLFDTKTHSSSQSSIECINGIRVMSMIWLLWTHTYLIPIKETFTFVREFMFTVEELSFQLILNGWVLVDTFFLVGAMLTTYTNFNRMSLTNGQFNVLQQILNRLFRFWPSLALTVMLIFIIPSTTSGPLWKEYFDIQLDKCYQNWWTTITFINNWYDESEMCLLHTWYLAADIQLFVFAFLLVIPLYKKPSFGIKLIIMTAMASALGIAVRTFLLKQNPTVLYNTPSERDVYNQASTIYVHTYIHLGPYCVGLLLGYAVYKYKTLKINPLLNLLIWLISLCGCLSIMLSTYSLNRGVVWRPLSGALYAGLHRTIWAICVSWIIFGCSTGNGGPINTFLSWKLFAPLGKLSFMIYLMHFLVIWVRYAYNRQPLPFSHYTMFCEFIVNLVVSTCVSIVAHLAIEAPMLSLYRIYLSNVFKFANFKLRQTQNKKIDKQLDDNRIVITSKL